jgi:phosphoribosylaminoimidazole (AIR) synthetase
MPSVMRLFGALGGLDDDELRATFNGGLGMALVLPPGAGGGDQ